MAKNVVTLNLDNTDYSFRPCGICSTPANHTTKVVSIEGFTLCEGATVLVKFTQTNISSYPTLNINSTGAKPIVMEGQPRCPTLLKDTYYEFLYDGSNWQLLTNTSILHKHYSTLNIGETEVAVGSKNWYTIGYAADINPCIYQISSYAHTNVVFSVTRAYQDAALTILNNSAVNGNADYAWINGVRLVKTPSYIAVQVRINHPKANNSVYVSIDVAVIPTRMVDTALVDELIINTTEYESSQILKSFDLNYVGSMYASNFIGELKGNADTASNSSKLGGQLPDYYATKEEQNNLANQLQAISAGLKVAASISPTVIYKNTATNVTISGTVKNNSGNITASEIVIKSGSTILKSATNTASTSITKSVTAGSSENTISYIITATASGLPLSTTVNLNARHPVYYGMGTSATNVKANGAKASARTTAVSNTTYDATADANNVRFYLLVPSDVTRPTSFTMGGAPVDMVIPSSTTTIDGIAYYVFYTNATYNSGGNVQIKAQ